MKISVLVPFGADDSPAGKQRAKVWRFIQRRWEPLRNNGIVDEVIIGVDPWFGMTDGTWSLEQNAPGRHQFSVSRALNDAAKHAHGDVFLMYGADHIPEAAPITWTREQVKRHPWVRMFDKVLYASEGATHLMVDGPFDRVLTDTADWRPHSAPCPGVLMLTRKAFETAGGMNEAFQGWGYEDTEFLSRLAQLVPGGQMQPCGLALRELWVPTSRNLNGSNLNLFSKITRERGW